VTVPYRGTWHTRISLGHKPGL